MAFLFSFIPLLALFMPGLSEREESFEAKILDGGVDIGSMQREGQTEVEMTDGVDKGTFEDPNSCPSSDEILQSESLQAIMEAVNQHGEASADQEETLPRIENNQQEQNEKARKSRNTNAVIKKIKGDDSDKETVSKAKQRVLLELASFEITIGFGALITIEFLNIDPYQSLRLAILSFLAFLTLLSGFCLLFHILFMLATKPALLTQINRITSKILIIISVASLILTLLSPITLLPKSYYFSSTILVLIFITLGIYFYLRTEPNHGKETDETKTKYNEQIKVITRLSELNQGLASLSSCGLIGILFGSWSNALNHAHHPYVNIAVFCMFVSFISSLLLMLLCQMRVDHLSSTTRDDLIRNIKASCVFLLALLASAAVAVSTTFLEEFVVAIFLPVLIASIVWFVMEFCTNERDNDQGNYQEEELKLVFTSAYKLTTVSFGIIMAIFGAYLGSLESHMHLNVCIFFMASAFISGMVLILLSYEAPKKAGMELVFSILGCCGISYLAFGGLFIFIMVLLRV